MIERAKALAYRTLKASEKYLKTDMVYLTKGGFWLMAEKSTAILFGFLMSVAFANLMEPEKYGVYKYVLSVMGVVGAFALSGMTTAVNQAVARGFEGALKAGFRASLQWSMGMTITTLTIAMYYFYRDNDVLGISFVIAAAFAPLIGSSSLYDNFLAGKQRFDAKATYGTVRNALPPLAIIAALFFVGKDPLTIVAVYFASTAIVTYWCYQNVVRRFAPHDRTDGTTLTFGKHLSIMNMIDTLSSQADRIVTFTLLGGTALAVYSFVEVVPDQIRGLGNIVGTLALPKMSKTPLAELKRTLPRKFFILMGFSAATIIVYVLVTPLFFKIFFPVYLSAVPYSQWYALCILGLPSVLFNRALVGHMRNAQLYGLKIASAIFRMSSLIYFVLRYGLWGIVIATILYYIFTSVLLSILFFTAKSQQPDISVDA